MKNKIIETIKERGYWRVNFRPLVYDLTNIDFPSEIIKQSSVKLRGWDYPHVPQQIEFGQNFSQGKVDWENHKEFWRMYKSGQFIHYCALPEDWMDESSWDDNSAAIEKKFNIIGSGIYEATEMFEFLKRLTMAGLYDEGVKISITLHNIAGKSLWLSDSARAPLIAEYKTVDSKFEFLEQKTKSEILKESKMLALNMTMEIFKTFGWDNPPVEVLKSDQEKLLKMKL